MKANVISIQDAYIATVSSVAESNYNYCAVVAKAWSKACKALAEIGWTGAAADRVMYDELRGVRMRRACAHWGAPPLHQTYWR